MLKRVILFLFFAYSVSFAGLRFEEQADLKSWDAMSHPVRKQFELAQKMYLQKKYSLARTEYKKLLLQELSVQEMDYARLMLAHSLLKVKLHYEAHDLFMQGPIEKANSPYRFVYEYMSARTYDFKGDFQHSLPLYQGIVESETHDYLKRMSLNHIDHILANQNEFEKRRLLWQYILNLESNDKGWKKFKRDYLMKDVHYKIWNNQSEEALELLKANNKKKYQKQFYKAALHLIYKGYHDPENNKGKYAKQALSKSVDEWSYLPFGKDKYAKKEFVHILVAAKSVSVAKEFIQKHHEELKDDRQVKLWLSEWSLQEKDLDGALKVVDTLKDPLDKLNQRINIYRKFNRMEEAKKLLEDKAKQFPKKKDEAYLTLSEININAKNYKEALANYEQLSKNPNYEYKKGWLYRTMGQHEKAIEIYDALATSPWHQSGAWLNKAYALEALNRRKEAIKLLQKICVKYPKSDHASRAHSHLQNRYDIQMTLGGALEQNE